MDLRHDAKCPVVVDKCECVDAYDYPKGYARLRDRRDRYGCSSSTERWRRIVRSPKLRWAPILSMADKVYFILKVHVFYTEWCTNVIIGIQNACFCIKTKILFHSTGHVRTKDLTKRSLKLVSHWINKNVKNATCVLSKDVRTKTQHCVTAKKKDRTGHRWAASVWIPWFRFSVGNETRRQATTN